MRRLLPFLLLVTLFASVRAEVALERTGRIERSDPQKPDNSWYDRYEVGVEAGDRLVITLESSDFNAYLDVNLPDGSRQTDDDGGGGTNSRLEVTATTSGRVQVDANTLRAGEAGRYTLRVERFAASAFSGSGAGASLLDETGRVEEGDPQKDDRSWYDRYEVDVEAGDRLLITLESSAFDAYLDVTLPDGSRQTNDDGGGGRNSRLEITATTSGRLRVDANTVRPGETGEYRVRVERLGSGPAADGADDGATFAGIPDTEDWIQGRLEPGDQVRTDESYQDLYPIAGQAGERIIVTMESSDFDAILILSGPDNFSQYNDDGAGGRNPRIEAVLPTDGEYTITANSYGAGPKIGNYRLRIERPSGLGEPRPTQVAGTLRIGESRRGRLTGGDAMMENGSYYDEYIFEAREGQSVVARLESSDIDPILFISGPNGFVQSNDDADGRNSRLEVTLPSAGTYTLRANSYGSGAREGAYNIILAQGSGIPTTTTASTGSARGTHVAVGEAVDGSLAEGDETLSSNEFVDRYVLSGEAGDRVAVDLSSSDFDPYLLVRGPGGFSEDNDDFTQGNRAARLEMVLPEAGEYRISATSYRAGETGNYRLAVTSLSGERAPEPVAGGTSQALAFDRPISGRLGAGAETLRSGEYAVRYTFRGRAGQRLVATMESSDFDAYLFVNGPGGFAQSNDDGEGMGRNSRLDVTLMADGDYILTATSYRAGEEGAYSLRASMGGSGTGPGPARPTLETARVWGIFVGITDYEGDENDLPQCARDATKLAEGLRLAGVMQDATQIVLTDRRATRQAVNDAFRRISSQVGPNDVFFFFHSGHGSQSRENASSDEPDLRQESIVLYDGEISDIEMGRLFDGLHGRLNMIVLDSCFSGGFSANVITRPGRMGLFSSEEDLTSAVPDPSKFLAGGYLSEFFRRGILGASDYDRNDRISAGELTEYIRRMYADEVTGVEATTLEGQRSYQHLVVYRGGVKVNDEILSIASVRPALKYPVASAGIRGALPSADTEPLRLVQAR